MSLKPLLPTLREKNRYLVLEIISDKKFSKKAVQRAIWDTAFDFLGIFGVAKLSLWVVDWDEKKQKGIVKVNKQSVKEIKTIIALIERIEGKKALPRILGISGTIKAAKKKWM